MLTSWYILLLFSTWKLVQSEEPMMGDEILEILLRNYNKNRPPKIDSATKVEIGIYLNDFYSISEGTMDYSVNLYLRQRWLDPRLSYRHLNISDKRVKLPDESWSQIWTPDIFFRNEKESRFHHVTTPNRLMQLYRDGRILYVLRLSVTLGCHMCLKKFPLDEQHCHMMLESFGHTKNVLDFGWLNPTKAVEIDPLVEIPHFKLGDETIDTSDCTQKYLSGTYPCLKITFNLRRNVGYYLTQMYVPTILIVVLSWVGFWISIESIPARVSLGLLTILTITTERSVANRSLPPISYLSAMDVWISTCLVFVFTSFLEFALVNYMWNRKKVGKTLAAGFNNMNGQDGHFGSMVGVLKKTTLMPPESFEQTKVRFKEIEKRWRDDQRKRAQRIDRVSRWLFPLVFVIFNCVYWPMYLTDSHLYGVCKSMASSH